MAVCPSEDELLGFLEGGLPVDQARIVGAHVDECAACTEVLARAHASEGGPADGAQHFGRYVVLRPLGAGNMGLVFLAYDPELDRKVALKLIRPDGVADAGRAERLRAEARALARLSHPNVINVYEVQSSGDQVYVSTEFVDGVTLADWLDRPHSAEQILDTLLQAGRGLAAAHSVGLTHRDFKPANVLISADGRVRVADFGLAQISPTAAEPLEPRAGLAAASAVAAPAPGTSEPVELGSSLRSGTPAYMAPEQRRGVADPRSDQFAYCLVLFEAFCGRRAQADPQADPQAGHGAHDPSVDVRRVASQEKRLPAWLRRVLARGLSPSPSERFPSMDELLGQIEGALARRKSRRLLVWAGVSAAVLAIPIVAYSLSRSPCQSTDSELASIWDTGQKASLAKAFLTVERPYTRDVLKSVSTALDVYSREWLRARKQVCEATWVRREQSHELFDLRMDCLAQRREDLKAVVEVLKQASPELIEKADDAVSRLPRLEACADARELLARVHFNADARTVRAEEALRPSLARARALLSTASRDVTSLDQGPMRAASQIDDPSFRAEALDLIGRAQAALPDFAAAAKTLEEAWWSAEAGGNDRIVASSAIMLVYVHVVGEANLDAGRRWARMASAATRRFPRDAELEGQLEHALGYLATGEGQLEQALAHDQRSLPLLERAFGEGWRVANALVDLGQDYYDLNRFDEALKSYSRALALFEAAGGPNHPTLAPTLATIGDIHCRLGEVRRCLKECERAWSIMQSSVDEYRKDSADMLYRLADALARNGRTALALGRAEEALRLREAIFGRAHPAVAKSLLQLATLHADQGDLSRADRERAEAYEIDVRRFGPASLRVAMVREERGRAALRRHPDQNALVELNASLAIYRDQNAPPPLSLAIALAHAHRATGARSPAIDVLVSGLARSPYGRLEEAAEARFLLAGLLATSEPARARQLYLEAGALFDRLDLPAPELAELKQQTSRALKTETDDHQVAGH